MTVTSPDLPGHRNHGYRLFWLVLVLIFSSAAIFSQDAKPTPTPEPTGPDTPVKIKTDLVTLTLTVTDLYGRYVSGLTKKAFSVTDNNEDQDITFFSDSDAPVSVGILFDVSGSMAGDKIQKARKALEKFIATSHPSDEYFLIAFNSRAQLLLDRTRRRRCCPSAINIGTTGRKTPLSMMRYISESIK